MDSKMIECPECGNMQPINSQKCYKCGFKLNKYLEQINKRMLVNGRNNPDYFYEISPQWQAYVTREKIRENTHVYVDRQRPRGSAEEDNVKFSAPQILIVVGALVLMVLAVFLVLFVF